MKNLFRDLLSLALVIAGLVVFALPARATGEVYLLSAATQNVSASATSNYTAVVNVRLSEYAGARISFKLTAAGTDNVLVKWAKSADGAHFETTPSITTTIAANGTNTVEVFAPLTVQGVQALELVQIVGSTNGAMTNLVVSVFPKNLK